MYEVILVPLACEDAICVWSEVILVPLACEDAICVWSEVILVPVWLAKMQFAYGAK